MANAIVIGMRGSDRNPGGTFSLIVTFCLYGADVDADVEGRPLEVPVQLPAGYGLSDFRDNIVAAVRGGALERGITVAAGDTDLPSYESG
jgi:hypothetical protein